MDEPREGSLAQMPVESQQSTTQWQQPQLRGNGRPRQRTSVSRADDEPPLLPVRRSLLEGPGFVKLRLALDIAALIFAVGIVVAARWGEMPQSPDIGLLMGLPPLTVLLLYTRGQYSQQLRAILADELTAAASAVSVASMALIAVAVTSGIDVRPGVTVAPVWALGFVFLACGRSALIALQRRQRMARRFARPALIVGAGLLGAHIARHLQERPEYGLRPIGFLDSDPLERPVRQDRRPPVLGSLEQLSEVAAAHQVVHVVFGFIHGSDRLLLPLVRQCQALGLRVSVLPRLFDAHSQYATIEPIGGLPLISLRPTNPRGWQFAAKHLLDRVGAALLVVVLAPLLAALALAVRLSSPGPVLFRQRRVGRDGQLFDLLKFRSMRIDPGGCDFRPRAGSAPGGVEGQDRRTGFGRWLRRSSLDELPQLFNVLKGEMSLIGPRPERPEFVDLFRGDIERYGERHRVKSGITGWAQVHGLRGQTSIVDRVEWDNYYIENWSLKLDLRVVALTVKLMLTGRAAE